MSADAQVRPARPARAPIGSLCTRCQRRAKDCDEYDREGERFITEQCNDFREWTLEALHEAQRAAARSGRDWQPDNVAAWSHLCRLIALEQRLFPRP